MVINVNKYNNLLIKFNVFENVSVYVNVVCLVLFIVGDYIYQSFKFVIGIIKIIELGIGSLVLV